MIKVAKKLVLVRNKMRGTIVKEGIPHFMFNYTSSKRHPILVPTFDGVTVVGNKTRSGGASSTRFEVTYCSSPSAGVTFKYNMRDVSRTCGQDQTQ